MNGEVWKEIVFKGMSTRYDVSSHGRVRNRDTQHILSTPCNAYDYPCISLRVDGKGHSTVVHRLVAHAFIGDTTDLVVNHIDGNKQNNKVGNLEIVSQKDNAIHSAKMNKGNRAEKNKRGRVIAYLGLGRTDEYISELEGVDPLYVRCIRIGKHWRLPD